MKKALIFCLAIVLFFMATVPIYASGNDKKIFYFDRLYQELSKRNVKIVDKNTFNNLDDESKSVITEYTNEFGEKVLESKDHGIYSRLIYKDNGDMYLNDKPIEVQTYDENNKLIDERILNINDIELRTKRTYKFENLPNGLNDNDLPEYLGEIRKVVSLGDVIWKSVAIGIIIAILTAPFIGLWGVLAGVVASTITNVAQYETPYSNSLSMIKHERKGMYVGGYLMILKTYMEYYGNKNFTGYLGNSTHYTAFDD